MTMDEEALNQSIRQFLKRVGVQSQREIEHAVGRAQASGVLGAGTFPAKMTLEIAGLALRVEFDGEIRTG
jgi:hypothetical protein